MNSNHFSLATGCLAAFSLLCHLISAGNFLPDGEVWLLGTIFWYIHYFLNFIARICLLCSAAAIGAEEYKRNVVTNLLSINVTKLKLYITQMLAVATFCIFVRFIMPGPVTSFTFFYKLSLMTALSAMVVTIVEDGGAGAKTLVKPIKKRLGMKK